MINLLILMKKEIKNIHIFFNDDKEEIKRQYINKADKIKTIKVIIDYQII